jgi:hypothetical protein
LKRNETEGAYYKTGYGLVATRPEMEKGKEK